MTFHADPSDLKVEDNLPLPARVRARERNDRIRALLRALRPGQSAFLPCPEGMKPTCWRSRIAVVASRLLGARQVATAHREENGLCGVRVWRLGGPDA
ncbi:hypothetical protein GCM10010964_43260 [Caldovatus sediminis]|uniref:Uncharacterized protein n=1 Tax=Caldovatus sediminis TaxID=2041189 RepID=A0A8J3ED12_9PROT|nr:hypothetical protein [Caldovatus sediminis]GGG51376.1 hypothetical protein GCM10010964_43260 [Caldovatus sediminis]